MQIKFNDKAQADKKSAAYMEVCEHFEEAYNTVIEC